jgi:hypothetical protein
MVERVAIIRNAKNEGIDMIDRERGQAGSICQQNGQVAVGRVAVGLPRTALWSVGGRPRSRGAAVIPPASPSRWRACAPRRRLELGRVDAGRSGTLDGARYPAGLVASAGRLFALDGGGWCPRMSCWRSAAKDICGHG